MDETPTTQIPLCISKCTKNPYCAGYQTIYTKDNWSNCYQVNVKKLGDTPNYTPASILLSDGKTGYYAEKTHNANKICTVPNIELQKWVNITLSADTNSMDIYILILFQI